MMIAVDKNVKIPALVAGRTAIYPFQTMEIGDSFFVAKIKISSLLSASYHHKNGGKAFSARSVIENGVSGARIWRTK